MKFEKEITVEVDVTLNELKLFLENKGFKIKEEYDLNDIYMINKNDKVCNNYLELFEALNFEELISIRDHMLVYSNGIDEFVVQSANNKHIYIEIEEKCNYTEKFYQTIDEMKEVIKKYNIPIKDENYFAKKSEIKYAKSLGKKVKYLENK